MLFSPVDGLVLNKLPSFLMHSEDSNAVKPVAMLPSSTRLQGPGQLQLDSSDLGAVCACSSPCECAQLNGINSDEWNCRGRSGATCSGSEGVDAKKEPKKFGGRLAVHLTSVSFNGDLSSPRPLKGDASTYHPFSSRRDSSSSRLPAITVPENAQQSRHSYLMNNHPLDVTRLMPTGSSDNESTYSGNSSISSGSNNCANNSDSSGHGSAFHRSKGHSCTSPRVPNNNLSRLRLQSSARDSKDSPKDTSMHTPWNNLEDSTIVDDSVRNSRGEDVAPGTNAGRRLPQLELQLPCGSASSDDVKNMGAGGFKRKRPFLPKLDIPVTSCFTNPVNAVHVVDLCEEALDDIHVEGSFYGVCCKRGRRDVLEDTFRAMPDIGGDPSKAFFGVFDGHGGRRAADFAADNMAGNILKVYNMGGGEDGAMEAAVREGYLLTDKQFLELDVGSGASCVTSLIQDGTLYVANAGDCRAVLSRGGVAEAITSDHRLTREDERDRVEALGGVVAYQHGSWRVQGTLAVSRGIGDIHYKSFISAEPEVHRVPLEPDCEFLVLASDGLWDNITGDEAVNCARPLLSTYSPDFQNPEAFSGQCEVESSPRGFNVNKNRGFGAWGTTSLRSPRPRNPPPSIFRQEAKTPRPHLSAAACGQYRSPPLGPRNPPSKTVAAAAAAKAAAAAAAAASAGGAAAGAGGAAAGAGGAARRPPASDSDSHSRGSTEACEDVTMKLMQHTMSATASEGDSDGSGSGSGSGGNNEPGSGGGGGSGGEVDAEVDVSAGVYDGDAEAVPFAESPLPAMGPAAACRKLVEMSTKRGNHDDVSVMIVMLPHFVALQQQQHLLLLEEQSGGPKRLRDEEAVADDCGDDMDAVSSQDASMGVSRDRDRERERERDSPMLSNSCSSSFANYPLMLPPLDDVSMQLGPSAVGMGAGMSAAAAARVKVGSMGVPADLDPLAAPPMPRRVLSRQESSSGGHRRRPSLSALESLDRPQDGGPSWASVGPAPLVRQASMPSLHHPGHAPWRSPLLLPQQVMDVEDGDVPASPIKRRFSGGWRKSGSEG